MNLILLSFQITWLINTVVTVEDWNYKFGKKNALPRIQTEKH